MSNEEELKEDVVLYLNERIKRQKGLARKAESRLRHDNSEWNRKIADTYVYGLFLLRGIKRDISR